MLGYNVVRVCGIGFVAGGRCWRRRCVELRNRCVLLHRQHFASSRACCLLLIGYPRERLLLGAHRRLEYVLNFNIQLGPILGHVLVQYRAPDGELELAKFSRLQAARHVRLAITALLATDYVIHIWMDVVVVDEAAESVRW